MTDPRTWIPTAQPEQRDNGWHVVVTWTGPDLDRPRGIGWSLGPGKADLAARLAAAVNAGAVFGAPELRTDRNGHTYISADCHVRARAAHADLTRLGY